MAVTTVYFSSQGRVTRTTGGSPASAWSSVRGTNTTTGNSAGASTNDDFGCKMEAARGGSVFATNNRAYFYFDLSSIGTTITAIEFKARGGNNSANLNGDWTVARANSDGDFGTIATSDYPLVFNSTTSFTSYGANETSWSGNADNTIDLNATAITNANSGGELCICLMNYTYDYNDQEVEENFGNIFNTLNFVTSGTTRARLIVSHADAPSGYGNPVNSIEPANISKINAILSADISKVNGI